MKRAMRVKPADGIRAFRLWEVLVTGTLILLTLGICTCLGSVDLSPRDVLEAISGFLRGETAGRSATILLNVRLPRVLCVALCGAALSLCGAAMQGLLKNPLADGSTLGVSSGASLGAALAMAFGIQIPGTTVAGPMLMSMVFAFGSLILILSLSFAMDRNLSTQSMILIGVIFTMFISSLMTMILTFSGEKIRTITFWTMGSFASSSYSNVLIYSAGLTVCAAVLLCCARELNAFSVGEENALSVGVDVRRVKLTVLICVSVLIGVCVSMNGTIAFVGLVTPHMVRMITGPNHCRLLPASMAFGAIFLMLADLAARILLRPLELPVGAVTSIIGGVVFMLIFYQSRRDKR